MAFRKLTDFVQENIIVAMIIDALRARNVAQNVISTFTDDSLGRGSSYKVPGVVDLTVNSYTGTGINPQDTSSTSVSILLNKYPFINFYIENSDLHEGNALSLAMIYAERAADQIASEMDKDVFTTINTGATADVSNLGSLASPITVTTGAEALGYVEKFVIDLREANVETNTALVVPSYLGLKLASELGVKTSNQMIAGDGISLGYINSIYGADLYTSNNLPTLSGAFAVVGGKRDDFALINGYTHIEAGPAESKPATWNQFGQVYGCGFVNANAWYKGAVKKA